MKIFKAIGSGFIRSIKVWKGILIVWFITLLLVSLFAIPIKATLKTGIGFSMITEKMKDGLNVEVLGDLGPYFKSLRADLVSGFLFLTFIGIFLNAFLAGGLFDSIKTPARKFSGSEFFRASARNFWTFLIISLIITAIIFTLASLIVVIPVSILVHNETASEAAPYIVAFISIPILAVLKMIFILVADFSRAWQVRNEKQACFKAIGFGFCRTFKKFLSAFPMMLIIMAVTGLFAVSVILLLGHWNPTTTGVVFLMFILSQVFFIMNLILKTWRYGSVTSLMEQTDPAPDKTSVNII
jgi:hypothetical protein